MTKKEKNEILVECAMLNDDELEESYYDAVDSTLGSVAELMEDAGYDRQDIHDRHKYEKYLCERADLIGSVCAARGIELWKSYIPF